MVFMTRTRRKIHGPALIALATLTALLAGCATAPPPIQSMDRAQAAIRAARNAGAATAAPDTLAEAERRLALAQQFSADNDNGKAADKAAEAEAAATTAQARAQAAKLNREIRQQIQVNDRLQADLTRRQAAAAAAQQGARAPAPATSTGAPASAASAAGNAPVMLPSIQLGQPAAGSSSGNPASGSSSGSPAPASTSGDQDPGVEP